MSLLLVVLAAIGLAAGTYLGLERLGRKGWWPAACRTVAWSSLGILLLNLSCQRPPVAVRPLVLLDASLSLGARGGRWPEARARAAALGEVQLVGRVSGPDSAPGGGRSRIAEPLLAAVAGSRPVWLVTDGEVEDAAELPADVLGRVGVAVLPRESRPDLAITRVRAPDRVAARDTLHVEVEVSGFGTADRREAGIEIVEGATRWLAGRIPLRGGSGQAMISGPLPNVSPGPHLLEVRIRDAGDGEARTDRRLLVLMVTPTPGIVVVANPASWESRFFYRTLIDVAALPVRGYLAVASGEWRRMGDLAAVPANEVDQAVNRADLLVQFGDGPERWRGSRARGRWEWVATSRSAIPTEGDWYAVQGGASPIAGAFIGLPIDSFPPAVGLSVLTPGARDWVGLNAQQNRRGALRPVVVGRDSAGKREILTGAAGLWRWAFRGGSSEQAYRAWVAASTSWLLGGVDVAEGRARPLRPVAEQGRPVVFERLRPDSTPARIELRAEGRTLVDTLRFDGAGRAELFLPPGRYDYRLDGGGAGLIAVEDYSEEFLPRPVVLSDRAAGSFAPPRRAPLRDQLWLFGLAILGFSAEWWWRRRAGLR